MVRTYIKQKALLTASIASGSEQKQDTGLVANPSRTRTQTRRLARTLTLN